MVTSPSGAGSGLSRFQPVINEEPFSERMPSRVSAELITLREVAKDVRDVADDLDDAAGQPEDNGDPDFDANLAEHLDEYTLGKIASDLLQGIESDIQSRQQWEKIATKAIEFLGLILEDSTGDVSPSGNISKVWHTLMLEASINFWANAYAEFLPADGPVKVRDDTPSPIGHNGGPPLDNEPVTRDQLADDFEADFNNYLTTGDRQYYRDFSRMLWSLGPIGTQFRKIYFNPLRKMAVSEWVKAENLIVSNEAADLATAGRITEKIMMRHADVKRLQYQGWWLNVPLTMPQDTPSTIDRTVGQVQGIKPGPELPADHRHTIYEARCDLDLSGHEHIDEDGNFTGLPLPYKVTLDKDSRKVLEIRRNWREGDEDFKARQAYVMFGMIPGFGFYFMGFAHILGNTERALTALEREQIDAGMFSIFPGFVHAKGTLRGDTTNIRVPPGGSMEINLDLKQSINDVLMAIPYKELSPNVMALTEKLEQNGRKLAAAVELPVGEGKADIPVGTMIAIIEEGTKVMAAVHKGLHQSRTEELELLRDLIAEDPSILTRFSRNPDRKWELVEEFRDFNLTPASDPNTPSHIHRVMRAIGLAQLAQLFPDIANRPEIYKSILQAIRVDDVDRYVNQMPAGPAPDPKQANDQSKLLVAQIQASTRQAETQAKIQDSALERESKERIAAMGEQTERLKVAADVQGDITKMHDSAAERAQDAQQAHAQRIHETVQNSIAPRRAF